MPTILFVHENFPAQFGSLAKYLAARGWKVVFATANEGVSPGKASRIGGVDVVRYERARNVGECHRYLVETERAVLNAQGFARTAAALAKGGFVPDIIMAHSGWGSGSFASVVWPNARFVQYLEWWYRYPHIDADPGATSVAPEDASARSLVRNLPFLLDLQQADLVLTPTAFQAQQAPDFVRKKTVVCHDGVDCTEFRPLAPGEQALQVPGVPQAAPIVSFATRGMEPMRGFPTFMAAMAQVQQQNKDAHILVAGNDRVHYGRRLPNGKSYKQQALEQHDFDMDRLHFTGLLPKADYARLLRRTNAHVYLSRRFVLSWSLIEAMATACPLVVSDVEPVREALPSNRLAHFVPLGDPDRLAQVVLSTLHAPEAARHMGQAARDHALLRYDAKDRHAEIAQHLATLLQTELKARAG